MTSRDNKTTAAQALAAAEARFEANNPRSKAQHYLALLSLPGGNTRTVLHTSPFPLTMERGRGVYLWDLDEHRYLDLVGELSAGLYGHSNPTIRSAVVSTLDGVGLSLGATTAHEQKFASLLCGRFGLGSVRMTNSGTEANLNALACARAFTGRRRVVVFAGGYHGGVLSFPLSGRRRSPPGGPSSSSSTTTTAAAASAAAASSSTTTAAAAAAASGDGKEDGMKMETTKTTKTMIDNVVDREDFVVVPRYNDLETARSMIEEVGERGELAAVLVEAVQGAGGCIPGEVEFLRGVRETARRVGALFVLDEVMTSRLAPGGLGREYGLEPDLVTLGKYLGGGLAFGAFGGREDVMAVYDPRSPGSLAHSGTFNNNTLVMRVGYEGLKNIYTNEVCREFNARGDKFRERLEGVVKGTRMAITGKGSLVGLHFNDPIEEGGKERDDLRDLFWFEMLEEGFWITRRGMIALILETTDEELEGFVEAVGRFLERHRSIMVI